MHGLRDQGKPQHADDLLAPAYSLNASRASNTLDLKAAKVLLDTSVV